MWGGGENLDLGFEKLLSQSPFIEKHAYSHTIILLQYDHLFVHYPYYIKVS